MKRSQFIDIEFLNYTDTDFEWLYTVQTTPQTNTNDFKIIYRKNMLSFIIIYMTNKYASTFNSEVIRSIYCILSPL